MANEDIFSRNEKGTKNNNKLITDQDPWMTEAIAEELPFTKRSFCIWHITYKFSGWFASILRHDYQNWCKDFYKLYKLEDIEEFESQWPLIIAKYNLQDNKHVKGLYEIKHSWVPAYLRGYYFGGMTTTGRSEYINGFITRFVSSNYTLTDLAKQVYVVVQEIMQKQSNDNTLAISRADILRVTTPLEQQVSQVLTPFVFQKFKEEYQKASHYVLVNADNYNFLARYLQGENSRNQRVFWDGKIVMCSCKQLEFLGILCCHVLRVFIQTDCHNLPSIYLPIRWQLEDHHNTCHMVDIFEMKNTNENERMDGHITNLEECRSTDDVYESQNFGGTNTMDGENILCPPKSKTKGRPKNQRLKSGKEFAKQIRRFCMSKFWSSRK